MKEKLNNKGKRWAMVKNWGKLFTAEREWQGGRAWKIVFPWFKIRLTLTSFGRLRMLDFPSGTIFAFSNSTSHGDGGPCKWKFHQFNASTKTDERIRTIWYASSLSVDESNVKSPNSTKPDSFGWNRNENKKKEVENVNEVDQHWRNRRKSEMEENKKYKKKVEFAQVFNNYWSLLEGSAGWLNSGIASVQCLWIF